MKVLLTALNSKYIHTNLAVRYLKEYAAQYGLSLIHIFFSVQGTAVCPPVASR